MQLLGFKTGKNAKPDKILDAQNKINKTYELLKNGDRFAEVAERFSEDSSTAVKGGVLPPFGVGKMVSEIETQSFNHRLITTDGVFSMDGYVANLKDICKLAQKYNALVHVDDNVCKKFSETLSTFKIDLALPVISQTT